MFAHHHRWGPAVLLVVGFSLTAVSVPALGQEAAGLSGRIVDGEGSPVAGAAIELKGNGSAQLLSTTSGGDGGFRFTGMTAGPFVLVVDKPDHGHIAMSLELHPGWNGPLEIVLAVKPPKADDHGPAEQHGRGTGSSPHQAFGPAVSVITGGYVHYDGRNGECADLLGRAGGFSCSLEGPAQGFDLGETELVLSGSVDRYFDLQAVMAVSETGIEIEEAFVRTRCVPFGFQLKAGKFKSGIGHINEQHAHQWDFADQALPYEMMFGGGLAEIGIQAGWLAPVPFYLQIGAEAFQGENAGSSSYLGPDAEHPFYKRKMGPRLFTGFIKAATGPDEADSLQGGLFVGHSLLHQEGYTLDGGEGPAVDEFLQGTVTFFGADMVFRHRAAGRDGWGDLTVQGEYIYRVKNMEDDHALARRFRQDGMYVQAVYGPVPHWTAGLRCDLVGLTNRAEFEGSGLLGGGVIARLSAELTWDLTELSRLRVQYNRLYLPVDGVREKFGEIYIQYQVSFGAHVHGRHGHGSDRP